MTPVEATSACDGAHRAPLAVSTAISPASDSPCGPVQALAQPLLVTMTCATPSLDCRCRCDNSTGAALAWLIVKMAAAETGRVGGDHRQVRAAASLDAARDARGAKPSGRRDAAVDC